MRRRRITEAQEERLAEEGKAHLDKIRGTGRPWLTRLAQRPPEWFDQGNMVVAPNAMAWKRVRDGSAVHAMDA